MINYNAMRLKLIFSLLLLKFMTLGQQTHTLSLNDDWRFQPVMAIVPNDKNALGQHINPDGYSTKLPNSAMNALLENGAIEDPFYRTNEERLQWLEKKDWIFEKIFDLAPDAYKNEKIDIILKGVDTYADVYLNDVLVLRCNNMFRTWRIPAKTLLRPNYNVLRLVFTSPMTKEEDIALNSFVEFPVYPETYRMHTRKAQFHYGWDWGPRFVTCGLASAELVSWNETKIEDIFVKTNSQNPKLANLTAQVKLNAIGSKKAILKLHSEGKIVEKTVLLERDNNDINLDFEIKNPKLWWTHNLGTPHLYDLKIEVYTEGGVLADTKTLKYGIRTIELVQQRDAMGESFGFKLNGVPVFAKGANFIPQTFFIERTKKEDYQRSLTDAKLANMNMLRVWGGGVYCDNAFYELADSMGMMIWQDFMYACAMYPADDAFLINARIEAEEQVTRLRNHPSIVLWCGNNEVNEAWHNWGWRERFDNQQKDYIWESYKKVFMDMLPDVVKTLGAGVPYYESSPRFSWLDKRSATEGDAHDWGVWHGEKDFDRYEERVPRFMSEYGFQSFPDWKTIESFTTEADRTLESTVMLLHQKHPRGNQLIKKYMEHYYKTPKDFENLVYLSQLLQAEGIRRGIEAHRRAMPYCMGTLYWQLNDVWQVASWSSIDYFGRWKALHYYARESFENVLVSPTRDKDNFKVYVVNDGKDSITAEVFVEIKNFQGENVKMDGRSIRVAGGSSTLAFQETLKNMLGEKSTRQHVAYITLKVNGKETAHRTYFFAPPKDLQFLTGKLQHRIEAVEGGFMITLDADVVYKNVFLSSDTEGWFENNFVDVIPNIKTKIFYKTKVSKEDFEKSLKIKSLIDSF